MKKSLSLMLTFILIFCLCLSGCAKKEMKIFSDVEKKEATRLGQGENAFYLSVIFEDGKDTLYEIHTDEETVGDALISLGLIEGSDGPYGLYIKSVAGIEADYDKSKTYWAFYINGEYATQGVDSTKIEGNAQYALKVE